MNAHSLDRREMDELRSRRTRVRQQRQVRTATPAVRKSRAKHDARMKRLSTTVSWVVVWVMIAFLTFSISSMFANIQLESARRQAISATQRAQQATADILRLRASVGRLTSMNTIESWASSRGFVVEENPQLKSIPKATRVASR